MIQVYNPITGELYVVDSTEDRVSQILDKEDPLGYIEFSDIDVYTEEEFRDKF